MNGKPQFTSNVFQFCINLSAVILKRTVNDWMCVISSFTMSGTFNPTKSQLCFHSGSMTGSALRD